MIVLVRDLAEVEGVLTGSELAVGDYMGLGDVAITREEIVEFGRRYDPLPIHTDPAAAAAGPFGDVIAPAALLVALYSSVASSLFIPRLALIAGKGIDRLRIPSPAVPGDVLTGLIAVDEVVHRGDRADVRSTSTFIAQDARTVLSFVSIQTVRA